MSDILKEQMLMDAKLILDSVDWLEIEINKKLDEFDKCIKKNKISEALKIKKQTLSLLKKINSEIDNMDQYMDKYNKLIKS